MRRVDKMFFFYKGLVTFNENSGKFLLCCPGWQQQSALLFCGTVPGIISCVLLWVKPCHFLKCMNADGLGIHNILKLYLAFSLKTSTISLCGFPCGSLMRACWGAGVSMATRGLQSILETPRVKISLDAHAWMMRARGCASLCKLFLWNLVEDVTTQTRHPVCINGYRHRGSGVNTESGQTSGI